MGKSEGRFGVWMVGHRDYVGGLWDEIGLLQFEFLKSRGLKPHHVLVDIACGSLRAGVHFIPCLDRGNYLGLDREGWLVRRGIKRELSSGIDFEALQKRPDFALVQSLFTHLNSEDIRRCLTRLRQVVDPGARVEGVAIAGSSRVPIYATGRGGGRRGLRVGDELHWRLVTPAKTDDG